MSDHTDDLIAGADSDATSHQSLDDFSDQLDAFQRLRSSDPDAADDFLARLGGDFTDAEDTIVEELSDVRVLARPGQFVRANRRAVKSIEVLYRNGRRGAPIKGWGPLRPVVQLLQIFVTSYITRTHVRKLLQATLELYLARENQAAWGSEEWYLLYRARRNLERLDDRYRGDRFGIPMFLVGGATFAAVAGGLSTLLRTVFSFDILIVVFSIIMLAVLAAVGSGIVQAAGVAKRRFGMTTQHPFTTLYTVVGAAGKPPRDNAWAFALGAVAVLLLLWVIIPGTLVGIFFN